MRDQVLQFFWNLIYNYLIVNLLYECFNKSPLKYDNCRIPRVVIPS